MNAPVERLVTDFKILISDTEALLKATAEGAVDKVAGARVRAQQALADARAAVARGEAIAVERTRAGAQVVDRRVHENAWTAIVVAAGIGLLVGWMLGRR